ELVDDVGKNAPARVLRHDHEALVRDLVDRATRLERGVRGRQPLDEVFQLLGNEVDDSLADLLLAADLIAEDAAVDRRCGGIVGAPRERAGIPYQRARARPRPAPLANA